jgi:hypothetical protein
VKNSGRLSILTRLQLGLEALYRVETRLAVEEFVIDEQQRTQVGVARSPREQLLVKQSGGDLELGLFVDQQALSNLERHDPAAGLHAGNFQDFCLAVEGVSHFIYLALCAAGERPVSALELELQAEVDKFVCCTLLESGPTNLSWRLFGDAQFADDLDEAERDRYRIANDEAHRYARQLERRFVARDRITDMLPELRRFYRLDLDGKLGHIARGAS